LSNTDKEAVGLIPALELASLTLQFQEKIYIPRSPDLYKQIVALCHDIQITGHPGHWKTLELVAPDV